MSIDEIGDAALVRMDDDEIREVLSNEGVGVLGLPDEDAPYLIPMSFGYDGGSNLYFAFLEFGLGSRKVELGERAGTARFLVYTADAMDDWRSVLLTGTIAETPDDEGREGRDAMENAWHPNLFAASTPTRGITGYRFHVTEWSGIKAVP